MARDFEALSPDPRTETLFIDERNFFYQKMQNFWFQRPATEAAQHVCLVVDGAMASFNDLSHLIERELYATLGSRG